MNKIEKITTLLNPVIAFVLVLILTGIMLKEHGWSHGIIKLCLLYMLPLACLTLGTAIGRVIKNTPSNTPNTVKIL